MTEETTLSITITILSLLLLVGCIGSLFIMNHYSYNARVNACIELGYSDIGNSGSLSIYGTCADSNDEIYLCRYNECAKIGMKFSEFLFNMLNELKNQ